MYMMTVIKSVGCRIAHSNPTVFVDGLNLSYMLINPNLPRPVFSLLSTGCSALPSVWVDSLAARSTLFLVCLFVYVNCTSHTFM